ncbi:thiamine phosphate synthase [Acaricomes phytoseiuli]|uniref:thiamine phosphate synthase n=1 Tax=Acaricomes phytoseiuli TaxID=291968 RepID=UPI002221373D|nr:thiamine phosphate synthase [Acaricomes phytoseiuli]MCW1249035.1 thiamine phosphate synthase [Acaricomes phytoseiuli]
MDAPDRSQLDRARLYVCTDARKAQGDLSVFLDRIYRGGADIVQLRDKNLEAAEELELLDVLRETAERHGKLWAVNDRADLAQLSGAPVLHRGQADLPIPQMRRILPTVLAGLSTHSPDQVDAALDSAADYFCVGPLWATPTKPGRPATGLPLVRYAADVTEPGSDGGDAAKPWFAIGGVNQQNLDDVLASGARRVVMVRAITDSPDPESDARQIRSLL